MLLVTLNVTHYTPTGAGSARPGLYRVLVIPTKRSAEGSLPHILIPSLRERFRRGEPMCSPCRLYCRSIALVLHLLLTLNLLACIFLLSFYHVLLLRKSTKTPGTRKKQSGGSLLTSRMRHSSVEPPLSLQPLRLLQGAAELILLIDNACSKWSRVAQT